MDTPEVPTGKVLSDGSILPDEWETLPDPATSGDLTPEQVDDATVSPGGKAGAVEYFVLRTVVNHDLVVSQPRSGTGPVVLAARDDSDRYQQWSIDAVPIGGGQYTWVYRNRATGMGIAGRGNANPYPRAIDPSNYLAVGWVQQTIFPSAGWRVYAVMTRNMEAPDPVDTWRNRQAMSAVDPRPGAPLQMVTAQAAYDTHAYRLEQVFLD